MTGWLCPLLCVLGFAWIVWECFFHQDPPEQMTPMAKPPKDDE